MYGKCLLPLCAEPRGLGLAVNLTGLHQLEFLFIYLSFTVFSFVLAGRPENIFLPFYNYKLVNFAHKYTGTML